MAQYVDKTKIEDILRNLWKEDDGSNPEHRICYNKALQEVQCELDTLEVKEVNEELAETYIQVFEKKFPILPTLRGKQLDKFKNFLNSCQQIFGLQEFGIHPVQAKLFEKLALLWAAWGAENLQGIGKVEGEPDVVKEVDLEEEVTSQIRLLSGVHSFHDGKQWWKGTYNELSYFAKHFYELGLKAQEGE